jgi:regulator of replication initiation timing
MQRHADNVTLDHIITLRREIDRLEKRVDELTKSHAQLLAGNIELLAENKNLRNDRVVQPSLFDLGY